MSTIYKNYLFLTLLLTISYQVDASKPYEKMMNLVRKNTPTTPNTYYDLIEYRSKVILSKDDVFGDKEEILQLSDAGSKLLAALTDQERAKLPGLMLIAEPGTFAMKFYNRCECCSKRYIVAELPTEAELDLKSREVTFT